MNMTIDMLEAALRKWDADSDQNEWQDRVDDDRFRDSAEYLFKIMSEGANN